METTAPCANCGAEIVFKPSRINPEGARWVNRFDGRYSCFGAIKHRPALPNLQDPGSVMLWLNA